MCPSFAPYSPSYIINHVSIRGRNKYRFSKQHDNSGNVPGNRAMNMERELTRRRFVALGSLTLTAAGLAGCAEPEGGEGEEGGEGGEGEEGGGYSVS